MSKTIDLTPMQAAFDFMSRMQRKLREDGIHARIVLANEQMGMEWVNANGKPVVMTYNSATQSHHYRFKAELPEAT